MDPLPLLTACIEHNDDAGVRLMLDEELSCAEAKSNCPLAASAALFCADTGAIEQLLLLHNEAYIDVECSQWSLGRAIAVRAARANRIAFLKDAVEKLSLPLSVSDVAASRVAEMTGEEKDTHSPLTAAAEKGHIEMVRLIVEELHAPVDDEDLSSRTALSYCSDQMDTAVVLISLGADVSHTSVAASGLSSEHSAKERERNEAKDKEENAEISPRDTPCADSAAEVVEKGSQASLLEAREEEGTSGSSSPWDSKAVAESKLKLHSASAIQRRAKLLSLTSTASPSLVFDSTPARSNSKGLTHEARDSSRNFFVGLTLASKFKRAQTGKNVLLRSDIVHAKAVLQKATSETEQARKENLELSVEVQQLKAHVTKLRANIAAIRKHLDRTAVETGGLPFNPYLARVGTKRATQPAGAVQRMRAAAVKVDAPKRASAMG